MRAPAWESVDNDTASLLDLLADDGTVSADYEWDLYVECLRRAADDQCGEYGLSINPNTLRHFIAGRIKPQRVGAFTHRALAQGLVEYTGQWVVSTDTKGRNSGKPMRELRWIGGVK